MQSGFVKVFLVVIVVLGLSAAGIYTMVVSGPEAHRETATPIRHAVSDPSPDPEDAPPADPVEPEKKAPAPEDAPVQGSPVSQPLPGLAGESQPVSDEDFDPLLGERFARNLLDGRKSPLLAGGATPQESAKNNDIAKIDAQSRKMQGRLTRKVNSISSRMRLDQRIREDLVAVALEGLEAVSEIRKQFAGQQMTDSDRLYMKDQIKAANVGTTQRIHSMLGDEKFREFKKQSRYYDNPNAQVLDEVKQLKKQNQQLQKKVDRQNKPKPGKKPGGRSGRPRRNR